MTNPELIAHILKSGGRLLIVGGETKDLPQQFHDHAQILIWDDNQQGLMNKEIPKNVKVILWNRWVSHSMVARLNNAAKQLHALKFPMLRTREIKALLAEVAQTSEPQIPLEPKIIEMEIEEVNKTIPPELLEEEVKETTVAKKSMEHGSLKEFIAKHINVGIDYKVRGAISAEGKRIFTLAQKEGIKTTVMSLTNGLGVFVRDLSKNKTSKVKTTTITTPNKGDDFEELERLISDAIVALKLVQEHMPKVRKETEKLRGMKLKFLKLLE